MGTIKEVIDALPDRVNAIIKNQLLEKLDESLKQQMMACGGDIVIDMQGGTYTITNCPEELGESIKSDLKNKK